MATIAGRGARAQHARSDKRGQSTVEFALVLPLVFALLVLVFQVALVARDEVLVIHAARAAAREASVTADIARITRAATKSLASATVRVVKRGPVGEDVEVDVSTVEHTDLPIVGALLPDLTLRAHVTMEVEQ